MGSAWAAPTSNKEQSFAFGCYMQEFLKGMELLFSNKLLYHISDVLM